ncbi:histidine kinase [Massilia sp. Dwa41.01b]|uniref:sensor histidine kinase n=1 Tax=Massilia sp. Dwa41.01b TaxID=2709302 RepID=UPI00160287B1|nr:sensor histidine kinase [Massilia sp. Dwa41.01b]QNA90743.1 histidine kinase [Massilia sp. Dwa41.01b]
MKQQQRKAARIVLTHIAFWSMLTGAGALGSWTDKIATGHPQSYAFLLLDWWLGHVPMMVLSSSLSLALAWRPALFTDRLRTLGIYAALALFLPLEWLYIGSVDVLLRGEVLTLASAWAEFVKMRKLTWFSETAWTSGTFIAMVALGNLREARARSEAFAQAQAENLNLHLALEQQRMLALRAQLEPHFIFNALNAISALVRGGDRPDALAGIGRLSDLLRYALSATQREQATIDEELGFVRDYLALQRLRYGERLRIRIEGDDETVRRGPCPPLLLQPLIENALRHDLDCHDGPGDIRLSFVRESERLLIRVMNPVSPAASPNPGTGLGLRNTRARLALADPGASLRTERVGEHFLAEISLPLAAQD